MWTELDTWTALTAALAAMACTVPGTFLVLRRQSMLGDALSHTVLPGIVAAFLAAYWLGIVGPHSEGGSTMHFVLLGGAVAAGLLTACLTEAVQRFGRVENSAALGVIYTSLFALGLLMVRLYADDVHLDADCVLFGAVETVVLDTVGDSDVPTAAVLNGVVLILNLLLLAVCFKELRLTTFDPDLATSLGLNSTFVHYLLMAITSVTLVGGVSVCGSDSCYHRSCCTVRRLISADRATACDDRFGVADRWRERIRRARSGVVESEGHLWEPRGLRRLMIPAPPE